MLPCLEQLGFNVVGYGCMTCIGNSGPLPEPLVEAIEKNDLIGVGVLSGNRNFEGRIHPSTRANYLASPPLVIAFAIAGRIDIDFENETLGYSSILNRDVYLSDIWPTRKELHDLETNFVIPEMFRKVYDKMSVGNKAWNALKAPQTDLFPWDYRSTYLKRPPFFESMTIDEPLLLPIQRARALLFLGDCITTDHISPAGSIARNSPAARYLADQGLAPRDFNSYGSRRGNDAVMARGTFANIRLVNRLIENFVGPKTVFLPTNQPMDIYEAAEAYKRANIPIIVLAGKEYGSGSSRDWAAKGPWMLGIRAIIAESYERIHRSNLIGMGIIPFQFLENECADSIGLTGRECFQINIDDNLSVKQIVDIEVRRGLYFVIYLFRFKLNLA
jgi:aconitate hydratase